MWALGHYMSCGISPAEILGWQKDDMIIYTALAELNRKQQQEDMVAAFLEAIRIYLEAVKKGR